MCLASPFLPIASMAKKMPKPRRAAPVSVAMQTVCIATLFPQFHRRNPGQPTIGIWEGTLQPSAASLNYALRITYTVNKHPCVVVLSPKIREDAPHRFADGSLCLYYPDDGNWHSQALIARTIIPWSASWLYFYENWLKTGEWLGPEAPHSSRKFPIRRQ